MARRSFPVYDFAVYGIKTMLANIRLFILVMLSALASLVVAFGVSALIAWPVVSKLMSFAESYKQQFLTCGNKLECWGVAKSLWFDVITPTFATHAFLLLICLFIFMVVFSGLGLGLIRIVLDLQDKKKSNPARLFSSFKFIPKLFLSGIIVFFAVVGGLILFVIPGIFLAMRLFFFKFYIVDKNAGIIECLKKSFHATRGLEWDILGIVIVAISLSIVSPIIGIPAGALMSAAAYRKVQK